MPPQRTLRDIALFALHPGLRDKELTHLSWADELPSQQGCLIFRLPAEYAYNRCSRLVICNSVTTQVVEARHGDTQVYISEHHKGKARRRISSGMGWKAGKGLAVYLLEGTTVRTATRGFKSLHFHDLRDTVDSQLMATEVSYDVRRQLLGHKDGEITAQCSKAPTEHLIDAAKRLEPPKLLRNFLKGNFLAFSSLSEARKVLKNMGEVVATGGLEPPTPAL